MTTDKRGENEKSKREWWKKKLSDRVELLNINAHTNAKAKSAAAAKQGNESEQQERNITIIQGWEGHANV